MSSSPTRPVPSPTRPSPTTSQDDTWDGVWETKAAVTDAGWTVEIRVPFNQIRFPKKDEYVWGINFKRMLRRKNEQSTFNWSPKSEAANVSRFARLEGIRGISPGGRVELMPYAVTQAELSPEEPGNPFATGHGRSAAPASTSRPASRAT